MTRGARSITREILNIPRTLWHKPGKRCFFGGQDGPCFEPIEYMAVMEEKERDFKRTAFMCRDHAWQFSKRHHLDLPEPTPL